MRESCQRARRPGDRLVNGVPCAGCGRVYPAERFRHGRTLLCECGTRVGRRAPAPSHSRQAPRLFADSMLGGLARWLRTLGYDTAWEPQIDDAELVRRGLEERRVVLTLDRRLVDEFWAEHLLLLENEAPLEQLGEVVRRLRLEPPARLFTRCSRCNLPLGEAPDELIRERAPPAVRALDTPVRHCAGCDRLYWEGSHTRRMRRKLREVLG